jgi:hypothetical protein
MKGLGRDRKSLVEAKVREMLALKMATIFFPVPVEEEMGRESTEMKAPLPLTILASLPRLGRNAVRTISCDRWIAGPSVPVPDEISSS